MHVKGLRVLGIKHISPRWLDYSQHQLVPHKELMACLRSWYTEAMEGGVLNDPLSRFSLFWDAVLNRRDSFIWARSELSQASHGSPGTAYNAKY